MLIISDKNKKASFKLAFLKNFYFSLYK